MNVKNLMTVRNAKKKWSHKLAKQIGICLLGIVLSFIVLAFCIQINFSFPARADTQAERLLQTVWRIEYLMNPIDVSLVSLAVSALDRTRYKLFLVLIAILPFILAYLAANSFSIHGFLFSIGYLATASLVSLLIPKSTV